MLVVEVGVGVEGRLKRAVCFGTTQQSLSAKTSSPLPVTHRMKATVSINGVAKEILSLCAALGLSTGLIAPV